MGLLKPIAIFLVALLFGFRGTEALGSSLEQASIEAMRDSVAVADSLATATVEPAGWLPVLFVLCLSSVVFLVFKIRR
jgi:hypothetical protein